MITRQSEQIEKLKLELKEKDEIINSVAPLKEELAESAAEVKRYKKQYKELIDELRKMKEIVNTEVYKNRWWLIRFLLK